MGIFSKDNIFSFSTTITLPGVQLLSFNQFGDSKHQNLSIKSYKCPNIQFGNFNNKKLNLFKKLDLSDGRKMKIKTSASKSNNNFRIIPPSRQNYTFSQVKKLITLIVCFVHKNFVNFQEEPFNRIINKAMQKRVKEEFIHVFHMMLLQNEQSIAYDLEEIFNLIENSSFNDLENSSLIISQISYWALTTFVLNSLLSLNFEDRREITKLFEVEILEPTSILLGILKISNKIEKSAIIEVSINVSKFQKNFIFSLNEDFIDGGVKIIFNKELED
ncbi:hypothetical protein ACQ4LE_005421 [Meloidogyne hapla]